MARPPRLLRTGPRSSGIAASTDGPSVEQLVAGKQRLVGAQLSGRSLIGIDLSGAQLAQANLARADLTGADLTGAQLHEADLSGALLVGANLSGADLTECSAAGANFGRANLTEAVLLGADLGDACLTETQLDGADLRGVRAQGARFRDASWCQVDASRADLRGADLERCDVQRACFVYADLHGARLLRLRGHARADWIGAAIDDGGSDCSHLLRREVRDQNYLLEFREQSRLHRAIYWLWWATSDCGRSFLRWALWTALVVTLFAAIYSGLDVDFGDQPTAISPLYFSVVTLTTLGYGDVLPVSFAAQVAVICQVSMGYLMLGGLLSIFANKMARRAD